MTSEFVQLLLDTVDRHVKKINEVIDETTNKIKGHAPRGIRGAYPVLTAILEEEPSVAPS